MAILLETPPSPEDCGGIAKIDSFIDRIPVRLFAVLADTARGRRKFFRRLNGLSGIGNVKQAL
jgi:hypothetical protein